MVILDQVSSSFLPYFSKTSVRYLFLKKQDGKFKAYSRICPSNVKRQPVILTDKEKEKIDKEKPNKGSEQLNMDEKSQYKGQEYDGLREMVKAIKKSLGPKRVG